MQPYGLTANDFELRYGLPPRPDDAYNARVEAKARAFAETRTRGPSLMEQPVDEVHEVIMRGIGFEEQRVGEMQKALTAINEQMAQSQEHLARLRRALEGYTANIAMAYTANITMA